mmetsp:Transcript_25634/g.102192  ORF Transcript_25634/g.102192 Transcript_25634/m.102192 type:complete len:210 (-) Transcript_25634:1523-2152(-)
MIRARCRGLVVVMCGVVVVGVCCFFCRLLLARSLIGRPAVCSRERARGVFGVAQRRRLGARARRHDGRAPRTTPLPAADDAPRDPPPEPAAARLVGRDAEQLPKHGAHERPRGRREALPEQRHQQIRADLCVPQPERRRRDAVLGVELDGAAPRRERVARERVERRRGEIERDSGRLLGRPRRVRLDDGAAPNDEAEHGVQEDDREHEE